MVEIPHMNRKKHIKSVATMFNGQEVNLPELAGVYAFWWIGDRAELMSSVRHMVLKGPNGRDVDVTFDDWWPRNLDYPCLYIGKTTNLKNRLPLHIMRGSPGRVHTAGLKNAKAKPKTSSCQLRVGIEHIFPREMDTLSLIYEKVGFSFRTDFADNAIAERFFEEDRLVGTWRPWFNIDSER
jgi:hypothetical protein